MASYREMVIESEVRRQIGPALRASIERHIRERMDRDGDGGSGAPAIAPLTDHREPDIRDQGAK